MSSSGSVVFREEEEKLGLSGRKEELVEWAAVLASKLMD